MLMQNISTMQLCTMWPIKILYVTLNVEQYPISKVESCKEHPMQNCSSNASGSPALLTVHLHLIIVICGLAVKYIPKCYVFICEILLYSAERLAMIHAFIYFVK